jgi:hypothetical protein
MRFKTNASNLDELDIAIAELTEMSIFTDGVRYIAEGECSTSVRSLQISIDRLAMFDYIDGLAHERYLTKWAKIREDRPDKTLDHSTHNLWPFTGKLEPRLARACINLAVGAQNKATIADPFCGSGTIGLEADLMGLTAINNDVDPFAYWLTMMKHTRDDDEFERILKRLWDGPCPPLVEQRAACRPNAKGKVDNRDAWDFLMNFPERPVDAVVTSPPYYNALNYNDRHAHERKRLGLKSPEHMTMGIGQSLAEYAASVNRVSQAMFDCLRPQGRIVLITAAYRGVDVPMMYSSALLAAGMSRVYRLKRAYRTAILDVKEDIILVMEKP